MLTTALANRVLIVSGALWCAAGITAGMAPRVAADAPEPAIEAPALPQILTALKGDREPLPEAKPVVLSIPFESRWPQQPAVVTAARKDVPQTVGATVSARRHHHVDRVCGERGRRWFTRHGWRTWRCRR